MKLQFLMIVILATALAGWSFQAVSVQAPVSTVIAQQGQAQDVEGASRSEDSPLDEFDPEEATWSAWLGPIVLGIFGLILVFAIRRFTHAKRKKLEERDETESERK